jgi:biotin carboxyl carrier protein
MQTKDTKKEEKSNYKTLVINETKYRTLLTTKFENRKTWEKPDEKKILSYLPGTAVKVNIKKGDKIKEGQLLIVFEAMKMMNTFYSHQSGVIKDVYVKPGDKFPKNFLIFEIK